VTKLDVLDGIEEMKICTGYRIDDRLSDILPVGRMISSVANRCMSPCRAGRKAPSG